MKRLICEMCGSTDLIKQEGVFVCQSCGCKYSVEEARKMMIEGTVEVTGTVQVDNSHLLQNYLDMAKNALDAGNYSEADSYCNRVLEIKPSAYEAWFIKGKAVGWQSSLANQRIGETISAFSKALEFCPEAEKKKLADTCRIEIENLHNALLTARLKSFVNHPNDEDVQSLSNDIKSILLNTMQFLIKAGISTDNLGKTLAKKILESLSIEKLATDFYYDTGGYPNNYEAKAFREEMIRFIEGVRLATVLLGKEESDDLEVYDLRVKAYEYMASLNDVIKATCSYDYTFDYYGAKSYYVSGRITKEAAASLDRQNSQWHAEAAEWKRKKTERRRALQAEKYRQSVKLTYSDNDEDKERLVKLFSQYCAHEREGKIRIDLKQKGFFTTNRIKEVVFSAQKGGYYMKDVDDFLEKCALGIGSIRIHTRRSLHRKLIRYVR